MNIRSRTVLVIAAMSIFFDTCVVDQRVSADDSQLKLRKIGLAMHMYHAKHKCLPPHANYKGQQALLSWRVHLLPFLGEEALYKRFRLNEPWDSAHNKSLITKMPAIFSDSNQNLTARGETRFQVPLGPKCIFDGSPKGVPFREIKDGASKTVLVVQTASSAAVVWTKPEDLTIKDDSVTDRLVDADGNQFFAVLADGQTRQITTSMNFLAMFTRSEDD